MCLAPRIRIAVAVLASFGIAGACWVALAVRNVDPFDPEEGCHLAGKTWICAYWLGWDVRVETRELPFRYATRIDVLEDDSLLHDVKLPKCQFSLWWLIAACGGMAALSIVRRPNTQMPGFPV